MSLQFIDFKKRLVGDKELKLTFNLKDRESLAIIDSDERNLVILRNTLQGNEDYSGKVMINGVDVKRKSELHLFSNLGFYSNLSLYQNLKFLLKINSIKMKKEELLSYFDDLLLNKNKKYSELEASERERLEILSGFLISKNLFLIDLSETEFINSTLIANFISKNMLSVDKNIVVLTKESSEISSIMSNKLLINKNEQKYFGNKKDFDIVRNLVVLKLSGIDSQELENGLPFDFTVVNNKLVIEKDNIESALYYFTNRNIEVHSISDFADNDDLYVRED